MNLKQILEEEVFFIRWKNKYVLFIPKNGTKIIIEKNIKNIFEKCKKNLNLLNKTEKKIIKSFIAKNLYANKKKIKKGSFLPTSLTILVTDKCNLNCVYCSVKPNTIKKVIDLNIANKAVDLIIKNGKRKKEKKVFFTFSGGEPTLPWESFVNIVDYIKTESKKNNIKSEIRVNTNGVMSKKQAKWIMDNINSIILSLDGYPEIHNKQRPLKNSKDSFKIVYNNLKIFDKKKYKYIISPVITPYSVKNMKKIFNYFRKNFKNAGYFFKYFKSTGKGINLRDEKESYKLFIKNFIDLMDICRKNNIIFKFTKLDRREDPDYCALGEGMFLTPSGLISSCVEVLGNDKKLNYFIFGKYDFHKKRFLVDESRRKKYFKDKSNIPEDCKKCFAKYTCQKHCAKVNFEKTGKINKIGDKMGCDFVREQIKYQIIKKVEKL